MNLLIRFLAVEILCIVGVVADYYLKIAGERREFIVLRPFLIGVTLYSITAIGWFLVLKYIKMVPLGVIYSVTIVVLFTTLGIFRFQEELGVREIAGLSCAIASLLLMAKVI